MLCAFSANAQKSEEQTMGTTSLSPGTATTSAQQEGATVTAAQREDEIEALRLLMSRYARWGDTQQWDKFGSLFHEDAVLIVDAGPRPDPQADPRIELHGREAIVAVRDQLSREEGGITVSAPHLVRIRPAAVLGRAAWQHAHV
jgi:hypothetical protein